VFYYLINEIEKILTLKKKVLLTNFDGDLDEWHLYDSLNEEGYRKSMSLILGEISHIFPETIHMFLNNRDVQRQEGFNDCGLFALAYMYTLCSGNNPSLYANTQSKMRDHYNNCIKNKYFEAFPHTSLKRKHINDKKYEYDVKRDKWQS
jgi:Ulp1 family protease